MRLPFYNKVEELAATAANMYRLGWHERNGGNISILLDSGETEGLDFVEAQRKFDTGFDASALAGRYLLVTGTGKYFKNLEKHPERDLGVIRISGDGAAAELVWGYTDGGRCTSELPSHLMGHISRLAADTENRVVMHSHPTNLIAMTCVHELDSREFTRTLWRMNNECIMVLPDGVNVLPWQLCGTSDIGVETAREFKTARVVVWAHHGVYACGASLDDAFGLIESAEKAAEIYLKIAHLPIKGLIEDEQLKKQAAHLGLQVRPGYLD